MTVSLIEGSSEAAVSDSSGYEQTGDFSATSTPTSSSASDRRGLMTFHVGDGVTLSQEDLELLLVALQTLMLLAWAYSEVTK